MPMKPKKPCGYSGCPNLVPVGERYCSEHKKLVDKQYNKYERDKKSQLFYQSTEWKQLRKAKLASQPLCEECLRQGRVTKANMVDHIKPIRQGGQALDMNNLQSLCWECHSKKSALEGSRWGGKREK